MHAWTVSQCAGHHLLLRHRVSICCTVGCIAALRQQHLTGQGPLQVRVQKEALLVLTGLVLLPVEVGMQAASATAR